MISGVGKGWDRNKNSMAMERVCVCVCVCMCVCECEQSGPGEEREALGVGGLSEQQPGAPTRLWPIVWTAAPGARGFESDL